MEKKSVRPVKVQVVGEGNLTAANNSFSGTARGMKESVLSFRVPGSVKAVYFEEGQRASANRIAARIDDSDYKIKVRELENRLQGALAQLAQLTRGARDEDIKILESKRKSAEAAVRSAKSAIKSAEAAVKSAKTSLDAAISENKRVNQLYVKQAASKRDLDNAKSNMELKRSQWEQAKSGQIQVGDQLEQAIQNVETVKKELEKARAGGREEEIQAQEAQVRAIRSSLNQAKANLGYTELAIPFGGIIAKKHISSFEQVNAGTPIFTLIDIGQVEVRISVSDSLISRVFQGREVQVQFLGLPGKQYKGVIHKIGITADAQTLTYPVFIKIDNRGSLIKPGMTANVSFKIEDRSTSYPTVPIHTILQDKVTREKYVWLFDREKGAAKRRKVVLGSLQGETVEVIEGLEFGDVQIVAGIHKLRDDMEVRLMNGIQ